MPTSSPNLPACVAGLTYKPGWRIRLLTPGPHIWWPTGAARYLELCFPATDSTTGAVLPFGIRHEFPVPPRGTKGGWERWLLGRILDAEHHETMEFFEINGHRPFYPDHGGTPATLHRDLYAIRRREPPP
jgi:hypothetical protein